MTKITFPYSPRDYQQQVELAFSKGIKRFVLNWHRRTGKDVCCFNIMVHEACRHVGVYNYIFPNYAQAKRALWDNIQENGIGYLDYIPKPLIESINNQEMKIKLINGSIIQLLGGDSNPDSFRSGNPRGVVLSEYAYMNPLVWERVLDPVLTKNKGWAIFVSTPQGKNHFYTLYTYALSQGDWYASTLTIDDTLLIETKEIDRKRTQGASEDYLLQEYYCSFDAGVQGAYYGKYITQMEREKRICSVPYDADYLVHTAWDLGFSDYMSIIFYQKIGNQIHVIDTYENSGYKLSHYLDVLQSKPYKYGQHFCPHDGKAHDRAGDTFVMKAEERGISFDVLEREKNTLHGIEKVRGAFPRMYFDKEKTEYLVKCLQQYHSEYDEKALVFRNRPAHDWSSHMADAFRYLVASLEHLTTGHSMTAEDLARLRLQANQTPFAPSHFR